MKLSEAKKGDRIKVVGCVYGRGLAAKLACLGVHVGDALTVVNAAPVNGPILIEVASSALRVAVGRGMAAKLDVEGI